MKNKKTRIELLQEFSSAPDEALFSQDTICALLNCSEQFLERQRWKGWEGKNNSIPVPYIKICRTIRYKKSDVIAWLNKQ